MVSLAEPGPESRAQVVPSTTGEATGPLSAFGRRNGTKRGSWLVRLLPILFAVGLVAVVGTGLWNAANPPDGAAPRSIGDYQLTEVVTGPAAVSQMSRLHGKGVGVTDGYVAHYQGRTGAMVAYVADTTSESDALNLLGQMEERIRAGNQYFTGLKPVTVDGIRVLSVRSGQESHYFWAEGKKVIWVALDKDDQPALTAAVRAIR